MFERSCGVVFALYDTVHEFSVTQTPNSMINVANIYTSLFIVKHDSKKGKSETIRLQGYNAHIR